jgi:predicted DNA-binding protein
MIRTQIQLTEEQAKSLKVLSKKEKKSMAELIRMSVDKLINSEVSISEDFIKQNALNAVGKLHGPHDLAEKHDDYLADTYS